jgi:hypothetical protein
VALSCLLPTTAYVIGRALQIRHLRKVLWRVTERRVRLLASASAGGAESPVAVSVGRR